MIVPRRPVDRGLLADWLVGFNKQLEPLLRSRYRLYSRFIRSKQG